ncbi:hypothetical protein AV903_11380 [Erwinia tracheiphila]|uniref:Uncharacterized protein n=1 Tax=Erwinia tracheiphila TaxID=65700 RepID=A0A345CST8_9GAMM|nr:hypothetical protein AV903_11380 [Erwinia tracheiphila]
MKNEQQFWSVKNLTPIRLFLNAATGVLHNESIYFQGICPMMQGQPSPDARLVFSEHGGIRVKPFHCH